MRKKLLSILLSMCMVLTLLPTVTMPANAVDGTTVRTEASLKTALANNDYNTIIILNDITLTSAEPLTVTHSVTINLSEYKLTGAAGADAANETTSDAGAGATIFQVESGGALTITGGGTVTGGAGGKANNTYSGGAGGDGVSMTGGSLIVTDGVTVSGGDGGMGMGTSSYSGGAGGCGIRATGGSLTVTSATIKGGWGGTANGDNSSASSGHAGRGGYGIYATDIGAFTVTDATVTGRTGGGVTNANRSLLIGGEGLRLSGTSSVTLAGSCTVTGGTGGVFNSRSGQGANAITSAKAVTIDTGSGGTTTITGGNGSGYGIDGGGTINVSVTGSGTATITGGDGGAYNNYYPGSGIYGTLTVGSAATVSVSGGYNSTTNPTFKPGVTGTITAGSSLIQDSADNSIFTTLSGSTSAKRYVQVLPLYAITKSAGTGGTLTVKVGEDAVDTTTAGQTVEITATPLANYELEAVTVTKTGDKTTTVAVEDNAFTMPNYPVTVSATFKALFYNAVITAKKDATAWADAPSAQVVLSTLSTDAATGQKTVSPVNGVFTFEDIPPSDTLYVWAKNNAGTYVSLGSVTSTSASMAVDYFTVALAKGDGIASVSGGGTYLKGENVTINAELNTDKTWSRWMESGGVLATTKSYTITGIDKAYALTALAKTDAAITIAAGQSKTYDGTAVMAGKGAGDVQYTYTGDATPVVQWYADNSGIRGDAISAPVDAGAYWIGVSAAATDNSTAVTEVFQTFTMEKATVDVGTHVQFDAPSNLDYNGDEKAATAGVKSGYIGLGTATLYYNTTDAAGTSTAAPATPGTYYVYASFAAGTNFKAVATPVRVGTFTVNKVDPAVALTSADTTTMYEEEVTLTATVTGITGGDTPTGTVTFKVGGTTFSPVTLDDAGKATLKKSDLNAATYSVTAVYNGDGNYNITVFADISQTVAKRAVTFTVSGTEQTYESGTAKTVSITGTGSRLPATDFIVQYYRVDENEDVLASTTPVSRTVAAGRYLYVISFKNAQANYEIARPYSVGSTALPDIADYDNIGYMDIKAGAADQQKPISFQSGLVSKYVTDGSFTNALTNENGTAATYQSSNTDVATVAPDGTVTIKAAGSTTITATSTKSGTTPVYASYTLNISKAPVTVTVQNESVVYGGASPYTGAAQLTFSPAIDAADYNAAGLVFSGYTVGKGVDTYDITARGLTSEKYAFTYAPGSLTVTQKALTVDNLTFTADNKVYNGTTAATGSVAVNAANLVGSDVLGVSFTASFDDADAADTKTVRFTGLLLTGSKADNYTLTATSGEARANITPAPVTVICQSTAVAFDGTAKTAAVSAYVGGTLFTHYDVTYKLGETDATATAPSAVGEYAIGIKLKDVTETNYTVTQPTATLTITDAAQDAFEIVGVPDTVTYGDVPFVLSAQGNTAGSTVTFAITGGGASASVAGNTVTVLKPGTVTITATSKLDGYKDKTRTATFTVKKKAVTVAAHNQTMIYGEAFSGLTNSYTVTGAVTGNEVSAAAGYTTNYTAAKGAGSYLITPSGLTSDYYTFTYEPGALTVGPKILTADDFQVSVSEKEYDGTTSASFTVTVDTVENDRLTAVYTGGFNASSAAASVDAVCTITGVTGSKADSYVLVAATIEKNASAKISPMPIRFTFGTTTYLYDTQQKAVAVSAVDSKNRVFSDFTVTYGGSSEIPKDVGAYTVLAVLSDSDNYTINGSNTAMLTITEGNVIVWASGATSWEYDGEAKAITPMSVPGVDMTVTYYAITEDGKVGDVATAPAAVGKYLYVITQNDPNYKIGSPVTVTADADVCSLSGSNFGVMEIAENVQAQPEFSDIVRNVTYGDTPFTNALTKHEEDATIRYTSSDAHVVTVDETSGEITILKPGTAIITATSTKLGYGDVSAKFAVQVAKKPVTLALAETTIVSYKGEVWVVPYTVDGDVTGNELTDSGITFTYTDMSDFTKHTPKNAGTYLASAHVSTDNVYYTSSEVTGYLQIDPAPLNVTADDKTITYGDAIPAYTVSYTLLGDDAAGGVTLDGTPMFTCDYEQFADVGSYTVTPSGLTSSNYAVNFVSGTLAVGQKEAVLTWTDPASLVYSASETAPTAAVINAVNSDELGVTIARDSGSDGKSIGAHSFAAAALTGEKSGNYKLPVPAPTHSFTITAATPTLTLFNQSSANTGNPISIDAATITGVGADGEITGDYTVAYVYYTDATCTTQTSAADGAAVNGGAPSEDGSYYVRASISANGNYMAAETTARLTIYTRTAGGNGGGETSYPITEGAESEWAQGTDGSLTFRSDGPYNSFRSVSVDSRAIRQNVDYSTAEGSTYVTLKPEYLSTLAPGVHTMRVTFSGGYSATTFTIGTKAAWVNPFTDLSEDDWFFEDVLYVHENELMQGTGDTTFSPHTETSRGMIVTILWRMEQQPEATKAMTFTDVPDSEYYHDAVEWAAENNIVEGYDALTFDPNRPITREQMAAILYRYAAYKGYDMTAKADLSKFSDENKIGSWAIGAMRWSNANELITGKGGGILDPQGQAERCEVAAILHRFCNTVAE